LKSVEHCDTAGDTKLLGVDPVRSSLLFVPGASRLLKPIHPEGDPSMKDRTDHRRRRLPTSRTRGALPLLLLLAVAGGGCDRTASDQIATWVTAEEYQLGGSYEAGGPFHTPLVRIDPERNRVVVADAGNSQVTVWTPEGTLTTVRGRPGEGLGALGGAGGLFFEEDGTLSVVDWSGSRFAYFTAEGEHTRTQLGPGTSLEYQGLDVRLAPPRDGVYLGIANVPPAREAAVGPMAGQPPVQHEPLLRMLRSDTGEWLDPEPLLWLDISNRIMVADYPDGSIFFGGQRFGDPDQVRFEPGAAVVMRTKGGPGSVELIEVNGVGDTVWHRRLQLEPRELTRERVDEVLDEMVEVFAPLRPETGQMTRQQLRDVYDEARSPPEYLAAAEGRPIPTSPGEIWFKTNEVEDDLRVHYAVRRGDMDEPPRRVLVPEWLRVSDATETHVWGVRRDEMMNASHVVGRRLVPAS